MSAAKTVEQLEKERRLDVCANCDTDRSKCEYGCGEENHWAARHSSIEEDAAIRAKEQNGQIAQQPQERHCPPHDLEDKDTYFVCRKCRKMFPAEDVVGD